MHNPYRSFGKTIFRSPYLSINQLLLWLSRLDESPDNLKEILSRSDLQEALFLASPVLHGEIEKYINNSLTPKEKEKFFCSVLKYLSRMASRCTPFGLFAGCSTGQLTDDTNISPLPTLGYTRHTRLDMNYLCALAQDIAKRDDVKYQLRYYPNTSCYVVGDKLRYVEYNYSNGNRQHNIVAVDNSDYLQLLLAKANDGAAVEQLARLLIDDEVSHQDAVDFIDELIDCQLLVSELEPSVTGAELLDQLIGSLKELEGLEILTAKLEQLNTYLREVDTSPIGTTLLLYGQIIEVVKSLGTPFNEKHLFQVDMLKPCKRATISNKISERVQMAMAFMNKLSSTESQETLLDKLVSTFNDRYENREISLLNFLDTEIGVDYQQSGLSGDVSPLLNGIPFGVRQGDKNSHSWNGVQSVLHCKITETLVKGTGGLELTDDDFKGLGAKWDNLPHTISAMCEVFSYTSDDDILLYLHYMGGSSAANLFGRFCHVDDEIHQHVQAIVREEENALQERDKLHAEIVHLPESRIGNILARPVLRRYEIPYLAKAGVEKEFQLEPSDLMVSIKDGKFCLRSGRLNKEVVPMLTTAHNYSYKAMPVYQFLCNLQFQSKRGGFGLPLNSLFDEFTYLPRITYQNVILSLARWHVTSEEFKSIGDAPNIQLCIEEVERWKTTKGIPRFVVLPDGDNELFVDTESYSSLKMLYSVVKKRPLFTLQEFPFDTENAIIKNEEGAFANEFIFTFHQ